MSFTPFAKMQRKQEETEEQLNAALKELTNTQAQLQKEKSTNREMKEDIDRATGRLAKNLAKLELLEKKIAYSDLFMQAKDVKCWKKDSENEVKALNLRILQAVTILEQMQRSGRLQLSPNSPEAAPPKEEFHCDCCQQKSKPGILIQDGKVINVPPSNAGATPKQQNSPGYLEKREADSSFRSHNRQLLSQLETERKRRREAENEAEELKTALKDQRKTIERLHENRRSDPSANVDVNATVRAKADSAFTQTRIKELEEVIAMKVDENTNLQKAVEKERKRADLNEKEINRVEKDSREMSRQKEDEKNEILREQIKKHFDGGIGQNTNVNVDVMKSYIRDLEAQLENPDNAALMRRIDACIDKVDSLETEKKGLKEYVIKVHKKLDDQEKDTELICKRLEYANEKNENLEIRRREFQQIADGMTEAKNQLQQEFDTFKRSVETGLGTLNQEIPDPVVEAPEEDFDANFELTEEDMQNIDPTELEEFLKNF